MLHMLRHHLYLKQTKLFKYILSIQKYRSYSHQKRMSIMHFFMTVFIDQLSLGYTKFICGINIVDFT